MIEYNKKPHCYKCYWRNYFSANKPEGTYCLSIEDKLYFICKALNAGDSANYCIVDLEDNTTIQNTNLVGLIVFLCNNKCMPLDYHIMANYDYSEKLDVCDCTTCE